MRILRTQALALPAALVILVGSGATVSAHLPTGGDTASWQKAGGVNFKYTPPSGFAWSGFGTGTANVKAGIENALEVGWDDLDTNNSNHMTFASGGGPATVFWSTTTEVAGCNQYATWQGCTWLIDPASGSWKMWFHKTLTYCEDGLVNDCILAERVAIHEVNHAGGFLEENDAAPQSDSVMQSSSGVPHWHTTGQGGPDVGWNTTTIRRCDEARMQILYDVHDLFGPYADCFDHVTNHGTYGMKTDSTMPTTTYAACSGDTVNVGGRVQIHAGHYGRELGSPPNGTYHLDKNPLQSRVVSITRQGSSYTTATATGAASGNDWSKAISTTTSVTITYNYTALFDRNANSTTLRAGLDSSPAVSFTITWVRPVDC
jgi:hypothetical protein